MTSIVVTVVITIVACLWVRRIYRAVRWWTQPAQVEAPKPRRPFMTAQREHLLEVTCEVIKPCDDVCPHRVCKPKPKRENIGRIQQRNANGDVVLDVCRCGECREELFDLAAHVVMAGGASQVKSLLFAFKAKRVSDLQPDQWGLFIQALNELYEEDLTMGLL